MKKIAILLTMVMIFNFNIRVEAADQEIVDGQITLEFLEKMSSWEELVNTVLPIEKSYNNFEDLYCLSLIKGIEKIYDTEDDSIGLLFINLEKNNYDRLMEKYQAIIDCNNNSNELQLVWKSEINDKYFFEIHIQVINNLATEVGQQVKVKANTTYWESALNGGTGNKGVTTEDNVVTVNGFAYLDESGNILETYYKPYEKIGESKVEINPFKLRMLHICIGDTDLGWVHEYDVERTK